MNDHIFRQYDIRGKVGLEFTIDEVYGIIRAFAFFFKQKNPSVQAVAVGADGRIHSPAIKEEVCRALIDSGLDVVFIGVCPTPVLYFSQYHLPVQAGIMITASHNGKEYNGFKIVFDKRPVWGKQLQECKQLLHEKFFLVPSRLGSYSERHLIDDYIAWLKLHFKGLVGMKYPVIVDCGNGAAGTVLPQLIEVMQWSHVDLLYSEVDGTYPNHEADPVVEANMRDVKKALCVGSYELGLGLDGDCDRMAPMTKQGELVTGDKVLAIFAQYIKDYGKPAPVVFDIKCSSGLQELLTDWGMEPIVSPSGHSNIKDRMKEERAVLGGELSCHFFFSDRYYGYDDGIYAMLRLFEVLQIRNKQLESLLTIFPQRISTPEIRVTCDDDKKTSIVKEVEKYFINRPDVRVSMLDGVKIETADGWALVRASNTQPVLCFRFEARTQDGIHRLQDDLITAIKPYFDVTKVVQQF
jgi:phosphomannomutase / phosphoglucomutase